MGMEDLETIGQNTPLSELGMDSMMAVDIKQTLQREFDIFLTAQDIRKLTLAKLKDMADENKRFAEDTNDIVDLESGKLL
ncbi:PREDICTED: fatty acid synthase-like, partial [Dinoponera quadriceps]|uniref:Fatty acid synthase-like n=1 Tax=Dinoponera quadriceps TaxID=609295 RepID=A0A6P3XPH8_DINQU